MIPTGLFVGYCFTSRDEDQPDIVAICPSGLMTVHATGPHALIHSETGRYTHTLLLLSPKLLIWMTLLFFFLSALSLLDSGTCEHCFTSGYTSGKSPIPLVQIIYFIAVV